VSPLSCPISISFVSRFEGASCPSSVVTNRMVDDLLLKLPGPSRCAAAGVGTGFLGIGAFISYLYKTRNVGVANRNGMSKQTGYNAWQKERVSERVDAEALYAWHKCG